VRRLSVGKDGPNLTETSVREIGPVESNQDSSFLKWTNCDIIQLANYLGVGLKAPVADETGLKGITAS